jgi:hypothetical protein
MQIGRKYIDKEINYFSNKKVNLSLKLIMSLNKKSIKTLMKQNKILIIKYKYYNRKLINYKQILY